MFTLEMQIGGIVHKMDTIEDNCDNLEPALKRFGTYLLHKARRRYEAQDFVPLAPSTIKQREAAGLRSVEKRLGRQLADAMRSDKARASTQSRRAAVLLHFQQQFRKGRSLVDWNSRGLDLQRQAGATTLSVKTMAGVGTRADRAMAKAVGAPILGKLPKGLMLEINNGAVTLVSHTKGGWSAVHNDGDGHVPKRETISLDAEDLAVFKLIMKEHLVSGVEET